MIGPQKMLFNRNSLAWAFNSAGILTQFSNNVLREAYDPVTLLAEGPLIEPTSSNQVANPRCEGAVPGTPGTMPSNGWSNNNAAGMTTTVVGAGNEDGLPNLDMQFSGTISGSTFFIVYFTSIGVISASNGQIWSESAFFRLLAGSMGTLNAGPRLQVNTYDSGNTLVNMPAGGPMAITSAPLRTQRNTFTTTLSGATITSVRPLLLVNWTAAQTLNFTLRIGLPQMEQLSYASSPIMPPVGSPGVSTRAADKLQFENNSYGPQNFVII